LLASYGRGIWYAASVPKRCGTRIVLVFDMVVVDLGVSFYSSARGRWI
jgi:hypothetical protein